MSKRDRIYYQQDPEAVIVQKEGKPLASYRSSEELIETHIKGLLALHQPNQELTRDLLRKYQPDDVLRNQD